MKYRPEIDGLRTIAVLAVILYHAEFEANSRLLFPGGFLGVDIFFVISGFLITTLIVKEQQAAGGFSIAGFYERRARRLLPALLVVILASLPFAWLLLLPDQITDLSKSIIASLFFGSNFYWHETLQEYGAESALLKPFLHTWSLAVEEQYYILFPLILVAVHRWMRARTLLVLTIGFLFSLQFANTLTTSDFSFSFYMLPSRFWELLSGGILAYWLHSHPRGRDIGIPGRIMPAAGLILITLAVLFIDLSHHHPGYITLVPVIGTLLVISYANDKDPVTRLLASRPFVAVGLISYSLYLWHYPIFAFNRIVGEGHLLQDKLEWLLITFALSVPTYFLIEKPFRNRKKISLRKMSATLSVTAAIVLGVNLSVVYSNGFPSRMPGIIAGIQSNVLNTRVCVTEEIACSFNESAERKLFLLGDSHMVPLEKPLLDLSRRRNLNLVTLNERGCQYIAGIDRVDKKTLRPHKRCTTELQKRRGALLLAAEPSTVVVGGRLPLILSEERFNNGEGGDEGSMDAMFILPGSPRSTHSERKQAIQQAYTKSILELAEHGHKIILVYPIPEVGWHVPNRIKQLLGPYPKHPEEILSANPITTSYAIYRERTRESFALLDGISHSNILRVYPHEIFCDNSTRNRCITHDLENSFYRDDDHLSDVGANLVVSLIEEKLDPRTAQNIGH